MNREQRECADVKNDRRREIEKRIKKRKKMREQRQFDDVRPGMTNYAYDGSTASGHPLIRKNVILFKILAAGLLFAATAVLFKAPSDKLAGLQNTVSSVMEKEMQFAYVTEWYEDTFGEPLAFLPVQKEEMPLEGEQQAAAYVTPVSGTVLETYDKNGDGLIIRIDDNKKPIAIQNGLVVYAGLKEGYGNTVIIQHSDKSESWYGNLGTMDVSLYDSVEKGQNIGAVTEEGTMFFAIKQGDIFVDPNKVISFE